MVRRPSFGFRLPAPAPPDAKYLASQERLITMTHLHWAVLLKVFLQTFGTVLGTLFLQIVLAVRGIDAGILVGILWYFALFMTMRMAWKVAVWQLHHITITDKRLIKISGVFARKVQGVQLSEITDITYSRDLSGRTLGYGEFDVEYESSSDDHDLRKIGYLPRPDRLYLTLCDMIFKI
jgi:hypothetical protein